MRLDSKRILGWVVLLAGCMGVAAFAGDRLPRDSKPLQEIAEALEKSGYVIVEAEIDDGRWEVDAYRNEVGCELHIDPASGKILAVHRDQIAPAPPSDKLRLVAVLKNLDQKLYSQIASVEFKQEQWEVEVYRDGAKRELQIDAETGKVVSDRADD